MESDGIGIFYGMSQILNEYFGAEDEDIFTYPDLNNIAPEGRDKLSPLRKQWAKKYYKPKSQPGDTITIIQFFVPPRWGYFYSFFPAHSLRCGLLLLHPSGVNRLVRNTATL